MSSIRTTIVNILKPKQVQHSKAVHFLRKSCSKVHDTVTSFLRKLGKNSSKKANETISSTHALLRRFGGVLVRVAIIAFFIGFKGFRELGNPLAETYKGFHILTNPKTFYRIPKKRICFRMYTSGAALITSDYFGHGFRRSVE